MTGSKKTVTFYVVLIADKKERVSKARGEGAMVSKQAGKT